MARSKWTEKNIPDQKGRVVIVTGATSGLGREAARVLAGKGASVLMAVRNMEKGKEVMHAFGEQFHGSRISIRHLDLTSLSSIENFSKAVLKDLDRLDILINNAGIMMCPYSKTEDGFEIQMGTNHLGHFALTGHLLPLLKRTAGSRIVVTSSSAHMMGNIDFSDINWTRRRYRTGRAYGDSKIANLYHAYELARKLSSTGDEPIVTAAHPGWTATDLQRHSHFFMFMNRFLAQGPEMGTLPTLRAAIDPDVRPGDYFGPSGLFEMHGYPVRVRSNRRSRDRGTARRLWELSEEMTGVSYELISRERPIRN